MSHLVIAAVESRRVRREFLELPWQLYRGDANWVPPLRLDQEEMVNFRPHPFYKTAEIQTFVAYREKKAVGRIAAIVNHAHNERFKEQRGFFGFFESVDDQEVAAGLFSAARKWLLSRGISTCRGPVNPGLNYMLGTLVEGFDSPPTFMMTYNPPYHEKLIEGCGFRKVQDLYAFWGHVDMLSQLDKKLKFIVDEATQRFNLQIRPLNRKRFKQEVRMFLEIYNRSLVGTWGFVPLSEAELDHLANSMKYLVVPEMTSVAEVDGKMIGAVFGLPDYNPRIKAIDGRLFPFGFLRLLWNRKAMRKLRIISANVLPEWQAWGIGLAMLDRFVPEVRAWGIQEAEFSWVLESNHLSRKSLERGGAIRQKTYRLYDYAGE